MGNDILLSQPQNRSDEEGNVRSVNTPREPLQNPAFDRHAACPHGPMGFSRFHRGTEEAAADTMMSDATHKQPPDPVPGAVRPAEVAGGHQWDKLISAASTSQSSSSSHLEARAQLQPPSQPQTQPQPHHVSSKYLSKTNAAANASANAAANASTHASTPKSSLSQSRQENAKQEAPSNQAHFCDPDEASATASLFMLKRHKPSQPESIEGSGVRPVEEKNGVTPPTRSEKRALPSSATADCPQRSNKIPRVPPLLPHVHHASMLVLQQSAKGPLVDYDRENATIISRYAAAAATLAANGVVPAPDGTHAEEFLVRQRPSRTPATAFLHPPGPRFAVVPAPAATASRDPAAPTPAPHVPPHGDLPEAPGKARRKRSKHRQLVQHDYTDLSTLTGGAHLLLPRYRTGRGHVSLQFPDKVHLMLDEADQQGFTDVLAWQPHGRAFIIHKPYEFVEQILQRYFKQSKLTSFQRQLNIYGFRRITKGPDSGAYYHECFLRGMPGLSVKMTRVKIKGNGCRAAHNPSEEPNFYTMPLLPQGTAGRPSSLLIPNPPMKGNPSTLPLLNSALQTDEAASIQTSLQTAAV